MNLLAKLAAGLFFIGAALCFIFAAIIVFSPYRQPIVSMTLMVGTFAFCLCSLMIIDTNHLPRPYETKKDSGAP